MDGTLCEPSAKRVRWDESVLSIPSQTFENDSTFLRPAAAVAPWCKANDALRLCSAAVLATSNTTGGGTRPAVGKEEEGALTPRERGFRPDFTHQLFEDERIEGFEEGQLAIRILYSPMSLDFLIKIQTGNGGSNTSTAGVLSRLSKALAPGSYTTDERSFLQELEGKGRDFKPPGGRVHEYRRGDTIFSVYRATGEDIGACDYHERAQCLAPWYIEAADGIDLTDERWEVFYLFEEERTPTREILGEKWRPAALAGYFTVFGFRNPVKGVSLRICQALILPQFQRQGHGQALLAFLYGLARSRESVFEITVEDPAPGFEKVRNLVDARTLRDLNVFPVDVLAPDTFTRPSKDVVQAAHEASKITVSQVEIGFDILKARDVPVAERDEAESSQSESATPTPTCISSSSSRVNTAAAAAAATATRGATIENTPPAGSAAITGIGTGSTAAAGTAVVGSTETDVAVDRRKRYRLMVKRRLLKRHGGELSTDASTRKRQLEELYRDLEADLLSLGAKLREEGKQGRRVVRGA